MRAGLTALGGESRRCRPSRANAGGSYCAWPDGCGSSHTDTSETTGSTAYDKLTVTAGSTTLAT